MSSIVETLAERTVGTVESVSADSISVLVDPVAPHATALNVGVPMGFPRVNGYLLVPNEAGATVGIVTSVHVERLPYPKRKGMQDFGLVDLPFPARFLMLTPIGTLSKKAATSKGEVVFEVRRGVDVFPSVGDSVLLPTAPQLRAIVEGEASEETGRVVLGVCPTAGSAPVHVNPNKLFGRHLAVLGNTGAGKSCTVAGLIRWSIEAASEERKRRGRPGPPNARFIVLDPNGEYSKAFADLDMRLYQVEPAGGAELLQVPAWLWNSDEWAAFTGAAPGVQRPILFEALRRLRSQEACPDPLDAQVRSRLRNYRNRLRLILSTGGYMGFPQREDCAVVLRNAEKAFDDLAAATAKEPLRERLAAVAQAAKAAEVNARSYVDKQGNQKHSDLQDADVQAVLDALQEAATEAGLPTEEATVGEDVPRPFSVSELPDFVEALASDVAGRDVSQFVDSLRMRISGLFAAGPLKSVAACDHEAGPSLEEWLTAYVGADQASNGPIAVIDLSLVPSEVIHVVVAVLGRMVFEAVQRHRRMHGEELPTVLVLEEAHTFVSADMAADGAPLSGRTCCRTFERIAREGRKFGLGLVLSSQRPSEISATVLSQCNTFILHRIVNDRDQDRVKRLVPDGLGDVLRELPSLPTRRAILLGWGAPAPVLVEVRELPEQERPHSPDPAFFEVWTGERPCLADWKAVAQKWTGEPVQAGGAPPVLGAALTGAAEEEAV